MARADVVCFMGDFDYSKFGIDEYLTDKYILQIKAFPGNPYYMNSHQQVKHIPKSGCLTFSGIAKPDNFKIMVQALNINVLQNFAFGDHHIYKIHDINYLIEQCKKNKCNYLATTEKDMVKVREFGNVFAENNIEVIIFPISIKILNGEEDFVNLIRKVLRKSK
jgi:tetraacyldisaccharide-1-P 4'-kinase